MGLISRVSSRTYRDSQILTMLQETDIESPLLQPTAESQPSDVKLPNRQLSTPISKNTGKSRLGLSLLDSIRWTNFSSAKPTFSRPSQPTASIDTRMHDFTDSTGTRKQSSLISILTIWNTLMGCSLLSMPWGIQQAGLLPAVAIFLVVTAMTLFTAHLVLNSMSLVPSHLRVREFSDVCRYRIGPWASQLALVFSLLVFFGAMLVYWVIMSNFLEFTGYLVHDTIVGTVRNYTFRNPSVICESASRLNHSIYHPLGPGEISRPATSFGDYWNLKTTPVYLAVLIFPLLFVDNIAFFKQFNALGSIAIAYLVSMSIAKVDIWNGVNLSTKDLWRVDLLGMFRFSGMLSLSFFLHNTIITIMRNNRYPERNSRDLKIAYLLTACTYISTGLLFFLAFPDKKSCISDNILKNFHAHDALITISRVFQLFQMSTVFPLIAYLYRTNFLNALFPKQERTDEPDALKSDDSDQTPPTQDGAASNDAEDGPLLANRLEPKKQSILKNSEKARKAAYHIINVSSILSCVIVAIFYPKVGKITSITGSLIGAVYIFFLPCAVYWEGASLRRKVLFVFIMFFGLFNFLLQFLP